MLYKTANLEDLVTHNELDYLGHISKELFGSQANHVGDKKMAFSRSYSR